jgi:diacylglycerol kinase family enzyme
MADYERGFLIQNKFSSHYRDPKRRARVEGEVMATGLPIEHVDAISSLYVLDQLHKKDANEDDLIFIAGGDGTVHHIYGALLSDTGRGIGLDKVATLPLLAGRACDIAHMLNDGHDPEYILQNGTEVDIHPMDFYADDRLQAHAFAYLTFHASALANDALEQVKHQSTPWERRLRIQLGREILASMREMGTATPIEYLGSDGDFRQVTEVAFFNGDRVAMLGHPHAHLLDEQFEQMSVNVKNRAHALFNMLRLQHNRLPGEMVSQASFTLRSPDGKPIRYQIEGEGGEVRSGTNIQITESELSVRALATRLK